MRERESVMMQRRIVAAVMMGLMLSGCGATGLSPLSARTGGAMQAAGTDAEAANPFTKLKISVEAHKDAKKAGVKLTATNGAKLKVALSVEDDALVSASVNRTVMVKDGALVLDKEDEEALDGAEAGDDGKREERRRTSYLKVLTNLASGLKAAKVKKDQEKDVKAVVDALKAFIQREREPEKED